MESIDSLDGFKLCKNVVEILAGMKLLATSVIAAMKGCAFVRVHDIKENVRAVKMTEAILAK